MNWSLATYTAGGAEGLGVLREDGTLVAPADLKRWASAMELLGDWAAAEPVLRSLDTVDAPPVDYDTLLAPLRWPRKVICAGVNYRRHMAEMGGEIPAEGWRPFFFLKAPTTSVIGPHDPILVKDTARARYDWEAELAVVIGTAGKGDIIEAVAVEGFAELRVILRNAREAAGSPVAALRELAGAYIGFALEHPALYDAMFTLSTELPFGRPETPRELQAAFGELLEAITPLAGERDPETLAEVAWSALHGVATLTRAHRLRPDYQQARLTMLADQLAGVPG